MVAMGLGFARMGFLERKVFVVKMYRSSKILAERDKGRMSLLRRAVLAFLTTGMVAWPAFGPAYATEIVRADGAAGDVHSGSLHKIYAGKDAGNGVGVSLFSKFDVSTGHVANMYFGTSSANTSQFNTLMNFVQDGININGTVNAIRGSGVGGHLYFLSPNGLAVGAGGAINTGSLTVIAPTQAWWKDNKAGSNIAATTLEAVSAMTVPINASGTIAIQGKVNATDDIRMKAGKINIGTDEMGANKTAAQLVTGTTDFSSLVNLMDTELEGAGIENLNAVRSSGSGDIVLTAEVSYNENKGFDTVNAEVNIAGGSKITAVKDVTIDAVATNNVGVTVYTNKSNETRYKVGDKDLSKSEFESQYKDASTGGLFGSTAKLNAKVNITDSDTNITGEVVHIGAEARNVVTNTFTSSVPGAVVSSIFGVLLNGLDVAYGILTTDAEVNIGVGTEVVAKSTLDKALGVAANAQTSLTLGTMDFSLAALTAANPNANLFPAVAFNYGSAKNDAKVDVQGTLKADNGGMAVEAVARNTINSTAATGLGGVVALPEGAFNFGINIVNGHNRSKVTVGEGAVVTAKKHLLVQADAVSSIGVITDLTTDDKAATAFLVNTFEYDNKAEGEVDSTLTSMAGDVTVNANSTYTDNTFTGNASVGKGFLARTVGNVLSGSQLINKGVIENIGNGVCSIIGKVLGVGGVEKYGNFFDKLSKYGLADKGIQERSFVDQLHSKIELGLSFGYMDEKNISLVNFGSKGRIDASNGKANVNAISRLDDVFTALNGANKNASTRLDVTNPNALANGALFMRGIENQADVIFEAPADSSQETVRAKHDVNITAKAEAPFNRVSRMKKDLDEFGGLSESDFKSSLGDLTDNEKEVLWQAYHSICLNDLADLRNMYDANGNLKPEYTDGSGDYNKVQDVVKEFRNKTGVSSFLDLVNTGKFTYLDNSGVEHTIILADQQRGFFSKVGCLFAFANPANYTNYAVSALTSGQDNSQGGASDYALAIGVGIDSAENMARIQVGRNSQVRSTGGNITLDSDTVYGDVALDGSYFPTGGGEKGTGGFTVGVHHLNNNSMVALAEQAKMTAAGDVSAKAKNEVLHIGLGLGLGMSKENTIAGTVQYVGADSNTLISIDNEAVLDANTISLLGDNDTTAVTITGGMAMGNTSAVGVAVGVLSIDRNNLVAIGDNDGAGTMTKEEMELVADDDEKKGKVRDDAQTRLKKLVAKKSGLTDEQRKNLYGSAALAKEGSVSVNALDVKAATNGHIVNVTADAGISMSSNEDAAGFGAKVGTFFSNWQNRFTNLFGQFDGWLYGKFGGTSSWVPDPTNQSASNPQAGEQLPSFSLSATGSVAVSDVDVKTAAVVEGTNITFKNTADNNVLNVQGADNSAIVAVAGGMAFAWKTNTAKPDITGKSGSFAGGAAVNLVHNDVDAIIEKNTINGVTKITNTAERSGTLAAAGAAIDISLNTGTSAAGMAAGISVNLADNRTIALMKDNTVNDTYTGTGKTAVENKVTDKDLQVTGALDINAISGDKNTGSIGAVVTWNSVKNTNKAEIDGGTYAKLGAVTDTVITDLTQINAALGLGVAKGTGAELAWDFQGSLLVDVFKNTAEANVKNVSSLEGDSLEVKAYDTDLGTNKFSEYLGKRGFDTKGSSYLNDAKTGSKIDDISDKGNLIVSASALISAAAGGSGGSGAFGAGVVVNEVDNDFLAGVENSTITLSDAKGAEVMAESNTLAVSVAAGGAGTTKGFCAAGSFVMDFLNNDVYAKVLDSTIDASKLSINALQKNKIVNVAGQISVGKTAIGLDFAYNWMNTNTGAYLTNTKVSKTGGETDITLDAENTAKMYAVAVGIEANTDNTFTGNGSVAVNRGHNNVEAVASSNSPSKNIVKAKSLTIHSKDDSRLVAAAGGLEIGGALAIGGALTWNRIGDLEDKDEKGKFISDGKIQVNRASLKGYTVSTTSDAAVKVQAEDVANLTTVSVGVGLTFGRVSVQGANANAYLDKETSATVEDSQINKGTGDTAGGKVSVLANTDNGFVTTAAVASVAGDATVGAGLAENTIKSKTAATLAGGKYALQDLLVKAFSDDHLLNVAVGMGAFGEKINVAGSLVFNEIVNDTTAILGKEDATQVTEVDAQDNVGVVSQSKENIENHSGQANIGKFVGIGLAVSSNEIGGRDKDGNPTGNTKALIQNAKVTAQGKGSALTVQDSTIYNKDSKEYETWSGTGVVVNADALHLLTNNTFSGGLSVSLGDHALAVGADAVTGVDRIDGVTLAKVYGSDINETATGSALSGQNVAVRATDRVDSTAVISNLVADVAPGIGATGSLGVGVSKDVEKRQVEAIIEGTDERKKVNANKITLLGKSFADLTVVNTAVSVSFAIGITGSVTTGVCYTDLNETTKALMKNTISYNNGLDILAAHEDNVDIVGTGVTLAISPSIYSGGAAVGVHVDSESNTSNTEAALEGSTIYHYTDNTAEDSIKAMNVSDVLTQDANLSVAFSVLSASVGVMVQDNDLRETVKTTVKDSTIGTDEKRAKKITVDSDNKLITSFTNQNVSGGMVGTGVGVGLNTVDMVTLTNITNSTLYSRNDIVADAKENISLNGTMVQVTAGALSVGVSTLHNYVNTTKVKESTEKAVWETVKDERSADNTGDKEYTAGKIDSLTKQAVDGGNEVLNKVNEDSKVNKGSMATGTKEVRTKQVVTLPNSGTKVNLSGAALYAAGNIATTAQSTVNSNTDLGGGSAGIVNIQVEVNKQHIKGDVGVNVTGGVMDAKGNITLNALMDGTLKNRTVQASVSGVQVLVTYSNVTKEEGGTAITLDSAKLTTDKDITLLSEDERAIEHNAVGASVAVLSGSGYGISSRDKAVSKIVLQNTLQNVGKQTIYTELSGKNININNYSKPAVMTKVVAANVSIASGSGVIAESNSKNQALLEVEDGVKLLGDKVVLDNGVNTQGGKYTLDADVTGVAVSGAAVHVNKARTYSDIKAETKVGAITLKTKDALDEWGNRYTVGISDLTVNAFDATDIHNDIRGVTVG
ncbi:MAG: leukotoxin LktA family filamentous adhesin, partial [Acidaminococcaceae bacterium]|nr:leukotoxin LktA family filamentous adhesin [Acidaminococcaceae bacterium]